jgi:CDP-diacylglycerol--serine O-phosphatidyltransferase
MFGAQVSFRAVPSIRARRVRPRRRVDLKKTLFLLPNMVTLASVFCGFSAILILAQDTVGPDATARASILLLFAMLFDLLDGRVARLTRTQSSFGLQLDSLADVISFGVAPALLVYKAALSRYPTAGLLVAFLFVACGVIRLARFNVLATNAPGDKTKPGRTTVGLPIPPAAAGVIALVVARPKYSTDIAQEPFAQIALGLTLLLSLLMVSTVPFRSFKDLKLNYSTILLVSFAVGSSVFVWRHYSVHWVLVWLLSVYVGIGVLESFRVIIRRARASIAKQSVPPPAKP